MQSVAPASRADQTRALGLSTIAFTACFAVWTIFSIIGVAIKGELGLNDTEFGLLVATPILTGSLTRIFLGVWTEKYGGRLVFSGQMLLAALATWALTLAHSYAMYLVAALGVGLAGGSFIIGVAYVSRWYDAGRQGTALGIFGAGNIGAAVTKFVAPFVMVAWGWHGVANVWAAALALMAVVFFLFAKDDPALVERRRTGVKAPGFAEQFAPLKNLQVWRFSLYYFFVFGAFVALALWLPHYLIDVYGVDVRTAGMAAASFSLSASLFRAYGGHLSDRSGARSVMYWTFGFSLLFLFMLSYPPTAYTIQGRDGPITFSTSMGLWPFVVTLFALGFFMSLGKAAVFKHIPVYYPKHVGAVGGLVGMIGGLGGFVLPIAFGALLDLTGIYTSCFVLLFALVAIALAWMHLSIRAMERAAQGEALDRLPELPEMQAIHNPERTAMPRVLEDWRPEDAQFWANAGGLSRAATCGSRSRHCFWPSRSGWSGRWWWRDFPPSASPSTRNSFSGWRHCRPSRARRCASSTASWCRSSAVGCGPLCRPPPCSCRPSASAMRCRTRKRPILSSWSWRSCAGWGVPTSPRPWPTSATSSRRPKRATRWR